MADLTANKYRSHAGSVVTKWYKVNASQHIYAGMLVMVTQATGGISPVSDAAGGRVVGIAKNEYDQSATASLTANEVVEVESGGVWELASASCAVTDVTKQAWAADSDTVVQADPTHHVQVGEVVGYKSATLLEVYIPPYGWDLTVGS